MVQLNSLRMRARAFFNENRLLEAFELYRQILAVNKKDSEALQLLGTICQRTGKLPEAEQYYHLALKLKKHSPELLFQLGSVLLDQSRGEEALKFLQQSLKYKRNFFDPWLLLGNIHAFNGRISKAILAYRNAIRINPAHPVPYCNLGNVLAEKGDAQQAFDKWRKALELNSDYVAAHSNMLLCMNYTDDLPRSEVFQAHRQWAQQHLVSVQRRESFPNTTDPEKRIRIGYLSPDFREHSVAYYMSPILEYYNRGEFEVFLYSSVSIPDERTTWFQQKADHYRNIALAPDEDVARLIEKDGIDILVDLAGHTSGNRLAVFGRKPAPVQVAYLGYPNTTGLVEMDYRLTDEYADPEDNEEGLFYTEKLICLKNGFLCYQPPTDSPEISAPPVLERGYVTFGSFNYTAKISHRVVSVWADILKQLPSSRLLLKYRSFSDAETREYYAKRFEQEGVDPERIQFLGLTPSKKEHLSAYQQVDIGLDSFPYNGTTTTCDTLWMGVPVIVLKGEAHAGRVGFSLLKRIGLNEGIACSEEEYIQRAVALANDVARLKQLRMSTREKMSASALCQPEIFVPGLERAYRELWGCWCQRQTGI